MNVLELFAGSRSIGKICDKMDGVNVFSVDIEPFEKINLQIDIEQIKLTDIPFEPDVIWASIPCTTYSIAAISHHRDMGKPKTDFAEKSDRLCLKVLELIKHFNCIYYIENPRGYLHKMEFMKSLPRATVWYCQYGDFRAKPTIIFSNNIYNPMFNPDGWKPKPECHNGNLNCHHEAAPRGSKTGTQGLKGNYERSKIPELLCEEIIKSTAEKSSQTILQ